MTSNLGSNIIQDNYADRANYSDLEVFERTKTEVTDLLKRPSNRSLSTVSMRS